MARAGVEQVSVGFERPLSVRRVHACVAQRVSQWEPERSVAALDRGDWVGYEIFVANMSELAVRDAGCIVEQPTHQLLVDMEEQLSQFGVADALERVRIDEAPKEARTGEVHG